MKKLLAFILISAMVFSLCSFAAAESLTVEEIIAQARNMSNDELYRMAIQESNGKKFSAIGNSSRGGSAGASFVEMLQKMNPGYTVEFDWRQPTNNTIFEELEADVASDNPIYSMTLIQDGNQIQSKMLDTGILLNFVPQEWYEAKDLNREDNENPLVLQTMNKVLMFNNVNGASFTNMWDFVAEGQAPLFMGVNSELIGKNFLYMMTNEQYSNWAKEAFEKLPEEKQPEFTERIEAMKEEAQKLGLAAENANYSLAWISLWCEKYVEQEDDLPICNTLATRSAADQTGLLVYSKLRSVEETAESSANNITVAAHQFGYEGIGGYAYKHYVMLTKTCPMPWTACAFIAYITTTPDGFFAWGRDMGSYAPVPACMQNHSMDGYVDGMSTYDAKNDRGYVWWLNNGKLVVEEPAYCASVSGVMSDWIDAILSGK